MVATPARRDMKSLVLGMPVFHSAGALLHQVSCRQVGDVELYSEGIAVVGIAHGKAAAADGIIKPAHMPADSISLLHSELHEFLNHHNGLQGP